MKKRILPRLQLARLNKKVIFYLVGALIIIACGIYVFFSMQAWNAYADTPVKQREAVKSEVAEVTALPIDTPEKRQVVVDKLKNLTTRLDRSESTSCNVPYIFQWQSMLADNAKLHMECSRQAKLIKNFHASTARVVEYLSVDSMIASVVDTIVRPESLTEADWKAQPEYWGSIESQINNLSVRGITGVQTKKLAVERVQAVKKSWQDVIAAHEAKDKVAYLSAQSQLIATYDELSKVSDTSQQAFVEQTKQMQIAFDTIFTAQ